jgi:hypothetical protein
MLSASATVSWRSAEGETPDSFCRDHSARPRNGVWLNAAIPVLAGEKWRNDPHVISSVEAVVAAIASSHMAAFLFLAAEQGWRPFRYRDEARAEIALGEDGPRLVRVRLAPDVLLIGERPSRADIARVHAAARLRSALAGAVSAEIVIEEPAPSCL